MKFPIITDQISCIYWLIQDFYPPPKIYMKHRGSFITRDASLRPSVVRPSLRWSLTL